jgi:hypothetical protein
MNSIEIQLEHCTLQEASQLSSKPQTQIQNWVEAGLVGASITVPEQKFLVYSKDIQGHLIGHAVCVYRGIVSAQMKILERIFDGERINLDASAISLGQHENIRSWSADVPFSEIPIGNIADWQPRSYHRRVFRDSYITPLPNELKSNLGQLIDSVETVASTIKSSEFIDTILSVADKNELPRKLNYRTGKEYGLSDLRIWYADIAEILEPRENVQPASFALELPEVCPQKRQDQFTQLLWNILRKDLDISAKNAWAYIRNDMDSDTPIYDTENILLHVDSIGAIWNDEASQERKVNQKSFRTRLSRLRVFARKYLDQVGSTKLQ